MTITSIIAGLSDAEYNRATRDAEDRFGVGLVGLAEEDADAARSCIRRAVAAEAIAECEEAAAEYGRLARGV